MAMHSPAVELIVGLWVDQTSTLVHRLKRMTFQVCSKSSEPSSEGLSEKVDVALLKDPRHYPQPHYS